MYAQVQILIAHALHANMQDTMAQVGKLEVWKYGPRLETWSKFGNMAQVWKYGPRLEIWPKVGNGPSWKWPKLVMAQVGNGPSWKWPKLEWH